MLKFISYISFAILVLAATASASINYVPTLAYANQTLNENVKAMMWNIIPAELKYTKDHEWIKVEGDIVTIGITDFAQSALGDIVFVELPQVGKYLSNHQTFGVVESIKSVSDLFSPIEGVVVAVNKDVENNPELVNDDAYASWFIKVKVSNPSQLKALLSAEDYKNFIKDL